MVRHTKESSRTISLSWNGASRRVRNRPERGFDSASKNDARLKKRIVGTLIDEDARGADPPEEFMAKFAYVLLIAQAISGIF